MNNLLMIGVISLLASCNCQQLSVVKAGPCGSDNMCDVVYSDNTKGIERLPDIGQVVQVCR